MEVDVPNIFKSSLYVMRSMKWDIVHGDEPLSTRAKNDLGMNAF